MAARKMATNPTLPTPRDRRAPHNRAPRTALPLAQDVKAARTVQIKSCGNLWKGAGRWSGAGGNTKPETRMARARAWAGGLESRVERRAPIKERRCRPGERTSFRSEASDAFGCSFLDRAQAGEQNSLTRSSCGCVDTR